MMSKKGSNSIKKTVFLDIGNSWVKAAFKKNNSWMKLNKTKWKINDFVNFINSGKHEFEKIVVASVRKDHLKQLESSLTDIECKALSISDVNKENLDYNTTDTLGIDRYLVCLGAFASTNNAAIVVDAGTACTIDYINDNGVYCGGLIMPGLNSIVEIFKNIAPELPTIKATIPKEWPGKSTQDSLQWGQIGFFKEGIEGLIQKFIAEFGETPVYITGGDTEAVSKLISLKNYQDKFLIFKGMEALTS